MLGVTVTAPPPPTTTTLPPPPTFVVLCPAPASFAYFGQPSNFTIGYQSSVETQKVDIGISWGDGQTSRYSRLPLTKAQLTHAYAPGNYQINAILVDGYGRSTVSSCTITWTDTLPQTLNAAHCLIGGGVIRAPDGSYVPDPLCAK